MDRKDKNENTGGVDFLAAALGVSESSVYARMRRGDSLPPCLQLGTRKIWRRETIMRWIAEHESPPSPDPRSSKTQTAGERIGRPTKRQQIERRAGGER